MAKSTDGIFHKRSQFGGALYYYRVGKIKSKDYSNQRECAEEFIAKFIEYNPKYKELLHGKTWEEKFKIFSIRLSN